MVKKLLEKTVGTLVDTGKKVVGVATEGERGRKVADAADDVKNKVGAAADKASAGAQSAARKAKDATDKAAAGAQSVAKKAKSGTNTAAKETKKAASSSDSRPYEERTKAELYERAQELDIEGRSQMSKDELITALRDA